MNAFLVVARLQSDDVPLRLFADRPNAFCFAKNISESEAMSLNEIMHANANSFPVCVGLVEFIEGLPQTFEVVQSWE